jgi:hypothetical protein
MSESISSMSQHPYVLFVKEYKEHERICKAYEKQAKTEENIDELENQLSASYDKMWALGTEVMLIGEINQKRYVLKVARLFNNVWLGTSFD